MARTERSRRAAAFTQAAVYTVIVIAILAVANFLANRYNLTYDSTENKRYSLADQTVQIADGLDQDVTISYWDRPDAFPGARDLLDRYDNLSSHINVVYEDLDKNPTRAVEAGISKAGTIFVQVGNKREEASSLTEEQITGAMVRALKGGDRTVCFTAGSGEPATDDLESAGFSSVKDLTERNNYKTQVVSLVPAPDIPSDCTILVVGGPKRDYLQPAVDAIKAYVEGGGRALIMLDPPLKFGSQIDDNAALTDVLAGWGVRLNRDLVLDLSGVGQLFGMGPELPVVTGYMDHAIVREMRNMATGFPITRSLQTEAVEGTDVSPLLQTTDAALSTTDLSSGEIDPKNGEQGARILAAAGTYKNEGDDKQDGRFVVVGTSRWIANSFLAFNGNRDLYLNMLNWLSSDEDLIAIRPKDPEDRRLNMNQSQMTLLFYTSVVGIPLLMLLAGLSVWWHRR